LAKKKRTEIRSKSGKLLYAVRDAKGEFTDIQTYKRAHTDDIAHKCKSELEAAAKKKKTAKKKKAAKSTTAKKKPAKKKAKKKK
jgi:hypothetical protein